MHPLNKNILSGRAAPRAAGLLATAILLLVAPVIAAPVTVTKVGTWSTAPNAPNAGETARGGKFVIKANYDTAGIEPVGEADRFIASGGVLDSTRIFRVQLAGSDFQLFVPLQGAGGVVETQTAADHFPVGLGFAPQAEIQFFDAAGNQFRGFEFESNFLNQTDPSPGGLVFEMFTADVNFGANRVTNSAAQILQCVDDFCAGSSIDITSTTADVRSEDNGASGGQQNPGVFLSAAVAVVADAGTALSYSATTLSATTNAGTELVTDPVAPIVPGQVRTAPSALDQVPRQADNDLGAARTDGEDLLTFQWTVAGTPVGAGNLPGTRLNRVVQTGAGGPHFVNDGTRSVDDVNITRSIAQSGLNHTTDTASWEVAVTEDITGLSDTDTVAVSYQNSAPTATASASAQGSSILFELDVDDADLAVNAFLGVLDFEQITSIEVLVDTIDQTAVFADLVNDAVNGSSQLVTNSDLVSQFGLGSHDMDISVTDKAAANGSVSLQFEVVAEPGSLALLLLGFLVLAARRPI